MARTIEKKRKAAPATASPSTKKTKKDEVKSKKPAAAESKSPKATKAAKPTVLPTVETGKKEKAPRKRAADFMNDEEEEEAAGWAGFEDKENAKAGKKAPKKAKKAKGESAVSKKGRKDDPLRLPTAEEEIRLAAEDSEDDQTSTLLKGFESSDDESDAEGPSEKGRGDMSKQGLPDSEVTKKKLKEAKKSNEPGVILISRIPHGFYEHEMKSYFTQFGDVLRIRLSRNKKTGRSKHYAFLEFASAEVAQIVADTMDNYLLFGHILKCKMIKEISPEDKERLFIGANKRFKAMPRAKMERRIHDKPRTEEEWQKKETRENARRKEKADKLKAMGIDYEFEVAKPVPEQTEEEVAEDKTMEDAPAVEEAAAPKKKVKKAKAIKATEDKSEDAALEAEVKKTIKEKKPKAAEKAKKAVPVAAEKPKKKKKSAK